MAPACGGCFCFFWPGHHYVACVELYVLLVEDSGLGQVTVASRGVAGV